MTQHAQHSILVSPLKQRNTLVGLSITFIRWEINLPPYLLGNFPLTFTILPSQSYDGKVTQNPHSVVQVFSDYYSKLYAPPTTFPVPFADTFFSDIPLPKVSQEHVELMEEDFTEGEVKAAIKSLHPLRAPGLNGFSNHYCRKYSELLTPHICSFFNDLKKGSFLACHKNSELIHVIPKPGKDHGDCANYRPISLITYKVLEN